MWTIHIGTSATSPKHYWNTDFPNNINKLDFRNTNILVSSKILLKEKLFVSRFTLVKFSYLLLVWFKKNLTFLRPTVVSSIFIEDLLFSHTLSYLLAVKHFFPTIFFTIATYWSVHLLVGVFLTRGKLCDSQFPYVSYMLGK